MDTAPLRFFHRLVVVVDLGFTMLLTFQVISVASEREKSDKFCSEALISAGGPFTCLNIYDTGPTALLPFRRKSYTGFLRSEKKT